MTNKKHQTGRLLTDDDLGEVLVITTHDPKKGQLRDWYQFLRNPNTPDGFRLVKLVHSDEAPESYDVLLRGRNRGCSCPGHLQWGKCKHYSCLLAQRAEGKI